MRSWDDYKKTMVAPDNLFTAVKARELAHVRALVERGADINEKDHRGYSALMLAAYQGNQEIAELLLKLGAEPNSADFSGNTVLMGVSFKGNVEIARKLVAAGADVHAKNFSGMTAYEVAGTFGRKDIMAYLETCGLKKKRVSRALGILRLILSRILQKKNR